MVDRADYRQLKVLVEQHFACGDLRLWISTTNLTELTQGITLESFARSKKYMSEALTLAQRRFILPPPSDYIYYDVKALGLDGLLESSRNTRKVFAMIQAAWSYRDYVRKFKPYADEIKTRQDRFYNSVRSAQDSEVRMTASERKKEAYSRFSVENRERFYSDTIESQFSRKTTAPPGASVIRINPYQQDSRRPAVLYWTELLRVFCLRTYLNKRWVRAGDGYDFSQALYLDICDYLITDDGPLRTMAEDTQLPELKGRLISLDAFLIHLNQPSLTRRCPIPLYPA